MLISAVLSALALPAYSEPNDQESGSPTLDMEATASFWWTLHEQVQNGLFQQGSGDPADDYASGFAFRHGRLAFILGSRSGDLQLLLRIRLEERTDIADFYGGWLPSDIFNIFIGQMKVPSTDEVLTTYDELDFASRSTFGVKVGDYSMTRTPYISSVMAAKSYGRDFGLALKGSYGDDGSMRARWFLMAGNGMGANKYIGGPQTEEFLFTNSFGDMYLGGRIEISPAAWLTAGAHAGNNSHSDVSLGDRGPVMDIKRKSWSADLAAGQSGEPRIYAFYGSGDMDDYFDAQRYLYDYSGCGIQGVWPLGKWGLELAMRFDRFTSESNGDGNETTQDNWTGGINWTPREHLRLQLNYTDKNTTNEFESDIDDNILLLNFQFVFDTRIIP
jgi:hypothetical protein